jgi:hypothetical protein
MSKLRPLTLGLSWSQRVDAALSWHRQHLGEEALVPREVAAEEVVAEDEAVPRKVAAAEEEEAVVVREVVAEEAVPREVVAEV